MFCAKTCPQNAVLSNRNKTATKRGGQHSNAFVHFSTGFARGKHSWKMMVDGIADEHSTSVRVAAYTSQEEASRVPLNPRTWVSVIRLEIGMKSNDILHCQFCCDTKTFTVTNERTMIQKQEKFSSEKDLKLVCPLCLPLLTNTLIHHCIMSVKHDCNQAQSFCHAGTSRHFGARSPRLKFLPQN